MGNTMKNSIALIGLMGAGKSTVGKVLANDLGWSFIDIDEEIVKHEKMSINDIFETKSEQYFRELETKIIKKFTQEKNIILSLGGGAFEKGVNQEFLLKNTIVIYLCADIDTIYERIKTDNSRPLLKCDNPKGKLKELLEKREPNYLKADFKIDTNKPLDTIIEEIKGKI